MMFFNQDHVMIRGGITKESHENTITGIKNLIDQLNCLDVDSKKLDSNEEWTQPLCSSNEEITCNDKTKVRAA
jgi:hypothetical protein